MSPEKIRDFEAEWPLLARRLKLFLARKRVPANQIDDLIQETALRLYKMWDSVDRSRPAWALTVTIALNLLRDEYRKAGHADIVSDLPDIPEVGHDVERAGMARVELGRVRDALARMTEAHRSVLLAEVGQGAATVDLAGDKMRRMRARRKLTQLLEHVSAIFVLPARKISDAMHALLGIRDSLVTGTSCLLCAVLGAGVAVTVPLAPERAEAAEVLRVADAAQRSWAAVEADAVALAATSDAVGIDRATGSISSSRTGRTSEGSTAPADGSPTIPLPGGPTGDQPIDPGDVPVPAPPPAPAPPSPPLPLPGGGPDNDDLGETVNEALKKVTAALNR